MTILDINWEEVARVAIAVGIVYAVIFGLIVYSLVVGFAYDKTPLNYHPAIPFAAVGLLVSLVLLVAAGGYVFAVALLATTIVITTMVALCRFGPRQEAYYNRLVDEEAPLAQPASLN